MKWYRPGDAADGEFTTANPSTGAATNADSAPTVQVVQNGVVDGAVTVTVTNPETGRYRYAFTVPVSYNPGDSVLVRVAATVGGVTGRMTAMDERLVSPNVTNSTLGIDYGSLSWSHIPRTLTQIGTADIADAVLNRNLASGSDGGRTVKDALRSARNRVEFDVPTVGEFTVFQEDDVTPAWTGTYSRGPASSGPLVSTTPV